jgi:hypothetical protein
VPRGGISPLPSARPIAQRAMSDKQICFSPCGARTAPCYAKPGRSEHWLEIGKAGCPRSGRTQLSSPWLTELRPSRCLLPNRVGDCWLHARRSTVAHLPFSAGGSLSKSEAVSIACDSVQSPAAPSPPNALSKRRIPRYVVGSSVFFPGPEGLQSSSVARPGLGFAPRPVRLASQPARTDVKIVRVLEVAVH